MFLSLSKVLIAFNAMFEAAWRLKSHDSTNKKWTGMFLCCHFKLLYRLWVHDGWVKSPSFLCTSMVIRLSDRDKTLEWFGDFEYGYLIIESGVRSDDSHSVQVEGDSYIRFKWTLPTVRNRILFHFSKCSLRKIVPRSFDFYDLCHALSSETEI